MVDEVTGDELRVRQPRAAAVWKAAALHPAYGAKTGAAMSGAGTKAVPVPSKRVRSAGPALRDGGVGSPS